MEKEQKRLLVLGGGAAALDVVLEAKKLGYYVIATDYLQGGAAKEKADKSYQISTADIEELKKLIEKEKIDGVFCGPSEFNIINVMKLCKASGLRFYASEEQWDTCANKSSYKQMCNTFKVPCAPEFDIADRANIKYPVIVKPVDGNSSRGITVCSKEDELEDAYTRALKASESKKALVEKFVESEGIGFNVRYIANKGEIYLVLTGDTYTVAEKEKEGLINAVGIYPSKYTQYYIENIDENVKRMFKAEKIENATFFMQALVEDEIYFHEMGLRLSGGLLYKLVEPLTGVNDMKMMIRYAVEGEFATQEEIQKIDPYMGGKKACIFNIPLKVGTIAEIDGIQKIKDSIQLEALNTYYKIGDEIKPQYIGTIQQHFGRFKFIADSEEEIIEKIDFIQRNLDIKDMDGKDMIYKYFDTARIKKAGYLLNNKR